LLIYAIRHSQIDFTRPLKFKDLHPVTLVSNTGWNGEKVKAEIRKAENILGNFNLLIYKHTPRGVPKERKE
jgi:hypothetical protein